MLIAVEDSLGFENLTRSIYIYLANYKDVGSKPYVLPTVLPALH